MNAPGNVSVHAPVKETLIEVKGLTVRFGAATILENLDAAIYKGETLAIVGASGAGKSVLLRSILGLLRRDAGEITAFGMPVGQGSADVEIEKRWGVLFQQGALFSSLSVAQNVAVPMREFLDLPPRLVDALARLKIQMVGLQPGDADKLPSELSGGMIKRAALARALAIEPEIIFLDEPTSGLDPISAAAFDQLIIDLRQTLGLTVVMVTHDLDSIRVIADRIVVVGERRILAEGTLADMRRVDHPWIRDYFNGARARNAFE